jgi:hypothetical protein
VIRWPYYGGFAKVPLVFSCLGRENMACKGVPSFYFTTARLFEALGGAPVGLDLRHYDSPLSLYTQC